MMGKGIGLPFGVFACLLIAVISARSLLVGCTGETDPVQTSTIGIGSKLQKAIKEKLHIGWENELSAQLAKTVDIVDVERQLKDAKDEKICETTPKELLNFKEVNCDLEAMTEYHFINPAKAECCRYGVKYNKGLCLLVDTYTEERIKQCERKIWPSLKAAWDGISSDKKTNVREFYSRLQTGPKMSVEDWLNSVGEQFHLHRKIEDYVPACAAVIRELSSCLPGKRALHLGDYNENIKHRSDYFYECKKYARAYCPKLVEWKEKCSDANKFSKLTKSYLPRCGSEDLYNLVIECEEIEVFTRF